VRISKDPRFLLEKIEIEGRLLEDTIKGFQVMISCLILKLISLQYLSFSLSLSLSLCLTRIILNFLNKFRNNSRCNV